MHLYRELSLSSLLGSLRIANIEIELFHHDRLAEENFGGISGVGQGSPVSRFLPL